MFKTGCIFPCPLPFNASYDSRVTRHRHDLGSDDFWTGYFFATGFHLVHVAVGVLLLAVAAARTRRGAPDDTEAVEALVLFWHMCDLAWFILLAVLYTGA